MEQRQRTQQESARFLCVRGPVPERPCSSVPVCRIGLLNDPALPVFGAETAAKARKEGKCCELGMLGARKLHGHSSVSGADSEECRNECDLPEDVALLQPPNLPFTNHVHSFNTLNCRQR